MRRAVLSFVLVSAVLLLGVVAGVTSASSGSGTIATGAAVSAGGRSVLDIFLANVNIACTPPGNFTSSDHLGILKAAIKPDGSFTAKTSQNGVFSGTKAKFAYSVTGHFHGVTADGAVTAAGLLREDIVFTDTATHTCTSNDQSWTATRSG